MTVSHRQASRRPGGDPVSVVDQIRRLTAIDEQEVNRIVECETSQLEDLEEVETALKSIGVTLKPRFDVSLAARIGATSARR